MRLRNATGADFRFINLSGGIGVDYRPEQPCCNIQTIGDGVRTRYEQIMTPAGMGDVAIFTELGRFMLAPYGHLVSTVLHQKHIYREYVVLKEDGSFQLIRRAETPMDYFATLDMTEFQFHN